jgi:hypothetical protein
MSWSPHISNSELKCFASDAPSTQARGSIQTDFYPTSMTDSISFAHFHV